MASLSILLPTLNCAHLLPAHVASMRPWLDFADEIIVVDSFSNDGTVEYLQRELAGLPVQFHSRPRGLYQAWNYGIQQATKKWLYISTVGDSISRDLLAHLLSLGEAHELDVVMSQPRFIDENNQPGPPMRWAIHDMLRTASPLTDFTLSGVAAQFFALLHASTSALLGSAASNLFRTSHLQKHPFPTEYGTAGDDAWGQLYAAETKFACTAMTGSTFRVHVKAYSDSDYHVDDLAKRLQALGLEMNHRNPQALRIPDLLALRDELAVRYAKLKQLRQATRIWYVYPSIWAERRSHLQTLNRFLNLLHNYQTSILRSHMKPITAAISP